jgi:hypothetical protein
MQTERGSTLARGDGGKAEENIKKQVEDSDDEADGTAARP